jgi:malic enzyme
MTAEYTSGMRVRVHERGSQLLGHALHNESTAFSLEERRQFGLDGFCRERTFVIGQANNAFVFPGIGLGVLVAEARRVTDGMLAAAARALADEVRDEHLDASSLFPPIASLRHVTARVAEAVVAAARDAGVGRPLADGDIPAAVRGATWEPEYPELIPA